MKINCIEVPTWSSAVCVAGLALGLAGCGSMQSDKMAAMPAGDGDVAVPAGYRSWARFVPTVDKPDGQIREIYINRQGLQAQRGEAFPSGTVSVMEIYAPRKNAAGEPIRGTDGRLEKDRLAKIFVMAKGAGWGRALPSGTLSNGDWLYGAYLADATTPATNDFSGCRSCHAPLADKDYVARYDEHFDNR